LVERELPKLEVAGSKPVVRLLVAGARGRYPRAAMAAYSFLTTWCVNAPVQAVWDVISASDRYPEWWKGVRKVTELEPGGEHGLGALQRLQWRSKLPYTLEFDMRVTRSEPPYLLEGHASGELEGVGIWRLYEGPAGTALVYSWDVSTTRAWMNRMSRLGRPIFAWNHDYVMRQGARGLAERLGVELVAHN
jgi:hypothetical protein